MRRLHVFDSDEMVSNWWYEPPWSMMMSHRDDDTVEVDISVTNVRSYYYNFYQWARRPSQRTNETNTDDDHVLRVGMITKRSIPTVESVGYMMILNNIGHG